MRGTSNTAIQAPNSDVAHKSDVIGPLPPDFDELERPDRALCGSPVALGAITGKIAGRPAALAFLSREPAFVPARARTGRETRRGLGTSPFLAGAHVLLRKLRTGRLSAPVLN